MPLAAVVSDDTLFVIQVSQALAARGWATLTCRETTAVASIKREHPDLVIFDLRDDRIDPSWTLLEALHREPSIESVPIIVFSGDARELRDNQARLDTLGATGLVRPFALEELNAVIDQLVGKT
jgi:DNA-binding response OmpR family regulator